jgi:hypothetical protein
MALPLAAQSADEKADFAAEEEGHLQQGSFRQAARGQSTSGVHVQVPERRLTGSGGEPITGCGAVARRRFPGLHA